MAYKDNKWKEESTFTFESVLHSIDSICKEYGLTKAWLAREIGVKPKTFNDWYNGVMICKHPKLVDCAIEYIWIRLRRGDYD